MPVEVLPAFRCSARFTIAAAITLQLATALSLPAQQSAVDVVTTLEYVRTRDGTRLAVDVHLPKTRAEGERLPALLELTRYWRASENATTGVRNPSLNSLDRFFLRNGYAVLKVDARGSGASFGTRPVEYGPQETRDAHDVVDWLVGRTGPVAVSAHTAHRTPVPQRSFSRRSSILP